MNGTPKEGRPISRRGLLLGGGAAALTGAVIHNRLTQKPEKADKPTSSESKPKEDAEDSLAEAEKLPAGT